MQKEVIKDNSTNQFIVIEVTKPQVAFFPKEESQQFSSRTYNYDGSDLEHTKSEESGFEFSQIENTYGQESTLNINSTWGQSDYIGAIKVNVPFVINQDFSDFKVINVAGNDFTSLDGNAIESSIEDLFNDVNDTDAKIISLFNGLQAVRIPINRLNTVNQDNTIDKNFGKYYIKISPKYVEAEIINIKARRHIGKLSVDPNNSEGRREIIYIDKDPFKSTAWVFEDPATIQQSGRLYGSVVEIWDNALEVKKQTKIVMENILELSSITEDAAVVLSPDNVGYDSPSQVATIGDVLRIYPRETYFNPLFIELDYQDASLDLTSLIKFLKNDAARNLETGVIEIYDDNGVDISTGIPQGIVIQAYQMSLLEKLEIRKNLNLNG